jgi:hypothetical protein
MRFDPDKHRTHQTFESACLERYRTAPGGRRRPVKAQVGAR